MSIFFVFWLMVLVSLTFVADIVKAPGNEQVIESLHIKSDIRYRFAITHISQVIHNKASVTDLVRFAFKIPYGALLQSLRAIVAGEPYDAKIVSCHEPNYNRTDRLPGLGKSIISRRTALGQDVVSFNVYAAGNSSVTVTLSYQQQLHRYNHSYEHEVYLPLTRPLEKAVFEAEICENKGVTSVKTPRLHPKDPRRRGNTKDFSSSCKINHIPSQNIATLMCRPKVTQSFQSKWYVRFALQYAVKVLRGGRDVVKEGDYFAFFMAPERMHDTLPNNASEKIPKDVICVIDIPVLSVVQIRTLFVPILYSLDLQDRLNVIRRDKYRKYRSFSPSLVPATDENQHGALLQIYGGLLGSLQSDERNVNLDLLAALEMMNKTRERDLEPRARMIIFFTDTYPTQERGGVDADKILRNVARANENLNVSIYSLAVGDYANLTFLQSLSQRNYGFVRRLPDDIHDRTIMHKILHEINSIVFTNLRISFSLGTVRAIAAPLWFPMVLNGTEVQIFGQLGKEVEDILFSMEAVKKDGEQINVTIEEKLRHLSGNCDDRKMASTTTKKNGTSDGVAILQKIWAFASLTQLIARLENDPLEQLERESIYNSMIDLAMKYKLVTPFTRMVFTPDPGSTYGALNCSSRTPDLDLLIPIGPTPPQVPSTKPTYAPRRRAKLSRITHGVTRVRCATLKAFTVAIRTPQDQSGSDKSICIIPCQWRPGKVLIFSNPGIMNVTLHICQKSACPQREIWKFIRFQAGADFALVRANYVDGWVYKASNRFQVNAVSKDEIEVSGFGLRTRIYRLMVDGLLNSYKLNITQEFLPRTPEKRIDRRPIPAKFGGISGKLLSDTEKSLNILKTDHAIQMCRDHPARFQALLRREKVEKFIEKANCGKPNRRKNENPKKLTTRKSPAWSNSWT